MGLLVKESDDNKERKLIPEDVHHAICISVIELGTIYDERWQNDKREVMFTWEFPFERIEFERDGDTIEMPMVISQRYTISLHEKSNLRKMLESWIGSRFEFEELQEGIDLKKYLNKNCMLQVVHNTSKSNGKTYANVGTVIQLIKGMDTKTAEHAPVYFEFDTCDKLPDVPEWILTRIMESQEYDEWKEGGWGEDVKPEQEPEEPPLIEDDVPF